MRVRVERSKSLAREIWVLTLSSTERVRTRTEKKEVRTVMAYFSAGHLCIP